MTGHFQSPRSDVTLYQISAVSRAVERIQASLQDGLAFLATVGSTAPFVGLFGTVWGIYHALTAIGISGQASIDKVAGPVGEALIMTAIGLAVAIPAVLGYNWLARRNKAVMDEVREFIGADVLVYQTVEGMKRVITALNPALNGLEASCFDGQYVAGGLAAEDAASKASPRAERGDDEEGPDRSRLAL